MEHYHTCGIDQSFLVSGIQHAIHTNTEESRANAFQSYPSLHVQSRRSTRTLFKRTTNSYRAPSPHGCTCLAGAVQILSHRHHCGITAGRLQWCEKPKAHKERGDFAKGWQGGTTTTTTKTTRLAKTQYHLLEDALHANCHAFHTSLVCIYAAHNGNRDGVGRAGGVAAWRECSM